MTGNKTEKKRISSKIFVALAALTLVSCCFLGTTFARYTTGTMSGEAGADIADWAIVISDGNQSGTAALDATISPDMNDYTTAGGSTTPRTNTIENGVAVTITNKGQVDANVTIDITGGGAVQYYVKNYTLVNGEVATNADGTFQYTPALLEDGKQYVDQYGETYQWDGTNMCPMYQDSEGWKADAVWASHGLDEIITVEELQIDGPTPVTPEEDTYTTELSTNGTITLSFGSITWTTDFDSESAVTTPSYPSGTYPGDIRDTWIGENVLKVGYSFTWSAVQASERP